MKTLQEKKINNQFKGDLMNYIEYLEMEKLFSGKDSTAGAYKATRKKLNEFLEEKNWT